MSKTPECGSLIPSLSHPDSIFKYVLQQKVCPLSTVSYSLVQPVKPLEHTTGTHSHVRRTRVSTFRSTLFPFLLHHIQNFSHISSAKVTWCWQGTILSLKLSWHQNMTVTSVKSIKYLHSTAHEALDIWQLHTEDDETPTLHVWDWELTGPCLATVHGFKGSRGSRQLLQRTLNTMIWKHVMMSPKCVPYHFLLPGGLIS